MLSSITRSIEEGQRLKNNESVTIYFRYDDALYLSDGVILYKDRVVEHIISLQSCVFRNFVHQRVLSMQIFAQHNVFWLVLRKVL